MKQTIKKGQIIEVTCPEHGTHTGEVLGSGDDVLIKVEGKQGFWDVLRGLHDFVAPIYDVIRIIKQAKRSKREIKIAQSKFK